MEGAICRFAALGLLAATVCAGNASYGSSELNESSDLLRLAPLSAPAPADTQPLFIIERSKNANVVHYDARLGADGKLDPKEPVVAYWIMLAEDGHREDLKWIEKKSAYGFDIKSDPSGCSCRMTVVSAPDREVTVKKDGDAARAELVIDGRPAILEKMYIHSTDGLLGPKVQYIELHGKDLKTGEKRAEKIVPD
jgi:hypothetical protein